jgi:hypothetical protein
VDSGGVFRVFIPAVLKFRDEDSLRPASQYRDAGLAWWESEFVDNQTAPVAVHRAFDDPASRGEAGPTWLMVGPASLAGHV